MKRMISIAVAIMIGVGLKAQTFTVDGIGYSITSDSTCGVFSCTTQNCNIPPTVNYNGVEYIVNAIYGAVRVSRVNSGSYYMDFGNGLWGYHNDGPESMCNNNTIHSITIPYTIETISYNALNTLTALTEVYWNAKDASIGDMVNPTQGVFYNCNNLTNLTIGDSVKKIPNEFLQNSGGNVTEIVIPDNVIEIGNSAFLGCSGLSSVTFSNNLQIIGEHAFSSCTGLFSVSLPDSVRTIGAYAFSGCSNMFGLYIGKNVQTFGDRAFCDCTSLHDVIYNPRNASYLSIYYLFRGSDSITNLTIGSEVENIPPHFMNAKPNIRNVVFPDALTHIGNNAFYNCGLEELVIPSNVTNIGQNAFYNNTNVSRIVSFPAIPPAIYQSTFSGISNDVETIVPCGTSAEYYIRPWWNEMANVKETCRFSAIQDTICGGEEYEYGTHFVSNSGIFYDTMHIDQYVDSIITLRLVVNPSYDYTLTEQICRGQAYSASGFNENESGIYQQTLQSIYGCDSIIRLNLTVNPLFDTTIVVNICQGDSYTQNGFNTSLAGTYSQHLSTIAGCDSVVHLQLTVNPSYSEHRTATITNVQNYQFVDSTLTQSGVYQKLLHTQAGCDSILTLTLTVIPSVDTLIVHDTVLYSDTIIVIDTLLLHDTTVVHDTTIVIDTFLLRDTIMVHDTTIVVDTVAIYFDTLMVHDTIYFTDTIVTCPVFRTYIYANIGMGDIYSDYGFTVSTAGVYCDTLQTIDGCDSIVSLYLTQNVGIDGEKTSHVFSVYPNPASSFITVVVPGGNVNEQVCIIDNTGKRVINKTVCEGENRIDVSSLSSGIYYVSVCNKISKLIIK